MMTWPQVKAVVSSLLSLAVSIGIAYAAGYPGVGNQLSGRADVGPVITYAAGAAIVIQWIVFVPAFIYQTEKYYDLTGSITYITITVATLGYRLGYSNRDARSNVRQIVCSAMVVVWALRLGSFLVKRIQRAGKDGRFDEVKPYFAAYLAAWTIQGLWVFLTLLSVLVMNTTALDKPVVWVDVLGWAVWLVGFGIEVVADEQKTAFNKLRTGKWVDVGLWRYSRRTRRAPRARARARLARGRAHAASPSPRGAPARRSKLLWRDRAVDGPMDCRHVDLRGRAVGRRPEPALRHAAADQDHGHPDARGALRREVGPRRGLPALQAGRLDPCAAAEEGDQG